MVKKTIIKQGELQRDPKCPVCLCFTRELRDSIINNGDKSKVTPIYETDGTTLIGFTIDGTDHVMATQVTYTFPATVAADGVMIVTGSDGSTQTVTIEYPEDVDIASNSVIGGVVQFVDSNGNALPALNIDMNPYISSPHPTITASGDATATFDSGTNTWTIGFVDTDTDTTYTMTQNANGDTVLTGSDGSVQTIANTDTDASAVKLEWDTDRLRSTVTEDGVDVVGELIISDGVRVCGDKALMVDPVTGGIKFKEVRPEPLVRFSNISVVFNAVTGAAVDALIGADLLSAALTVPPFATNADCRINDRKSVSVRIGAFSSNQGAEDDIWRYRITVNGDANPMVAGDVIHTAGISGAFSELDGTPAHSGSYSWRVGVAATINEAYSLKFLPIVYTPVFNNSIYRMVMTIYIERSQITEGV